MSLPSVLAIIPARAGSKGVPGKNVKRFDGKSLTAYACELAVSIPSITQTILTTDDEELLQLDKHYPIVALRRPAHLATDDALVQQAILHALQFAEEKFSTRYDFILLLQPTSPLRTARQAEAIIALLQNNAEADGVVSVVQTEDAHPARMYRVEDGMMYALQPAEEFALRQQLPLVYLRNGCFYLARREALLREDTIIVSKKLAYIMPAAWALNIDSPTDALLAEILFPKWKQWLAEQGQL